ncbi:UDP-3-O-(3-hydroxymyristoyl)glucosamine N-acyltransferase [Bacteriovoracaceae bacterium]|nr:UDP-3-O-(3-hydroxymyristoyl)glucosamine N-acyltransferase [Bacteriovoracaceae bacterium]
MNLDDFKKLDSSFELVGLEKDFFEISTISHITEPRDGSFVFAKSSKFIERAGEKLDRDGFIKTAIILEKKLADSLDKQALIDLKVKFGWLATVESVAVSMTKYSKIFYDKKFSHLNYFVDGRQMGSAHIDSSAQIAQDVFIGCDVTIGQDVVIMPGVKILPNVIIGAGTIIFPNTVIYPYSSIGKNCRVHASVTIGADGFGYSFHQGEHCKIWHFGGVEISDEVEIGANSTIDAGGFYPTRIGAGTKIDNHCTVGHNAQLGQGIIVCGQGAIAGSVEMSDFSVMGGRAGIGPDVRVGEGAQIAAGAIVSEGSIVKAGEVLAGHPARPLREWLKGLAFIRNSSLK